MVEEVDAVAVDHLVDGEVLTGLAALLATAVEVVAMAGLLICPEEGKLILRITLPEALLMVSQLPRRISRTRSRLQPVLSSLYFHGGLRLLEVLCVNAKDASSSSKIVPGGDGVI